GVQRDKSHGAPRLVALHRRVAPLANHTQDSHPIWRNHATVSATESLTARGRMPNSARLRDASKCMRRRVSFTPVTVAAGMLPVIASATNSLTYSAASATGDGTRQRGCAAPDSFAACS